jgi:GTPase
MCPKQVRRDTINKLGSILKSPQVGKIPFLVRSQADVMVALKAMKGGGQRVVPVFPVSNVTGHNLDLLKSFLNLLQSSRSWEMASELDAEFHIDQTFQVPGIGLVLSGTMFSGKVKQGDLLWLGPLGDNSFTPVTVKTIHTKRTPVGSVRAGLDACFAVKAMDKAVKLRREMVRRGMAMVQSKDAAHATWEFEAEVRVLQHPTTIRANYSPVIHAHSIRQAARIVSMEQESLRTGDTALLRFRFQFRSEFITPGTTILFCEGMTKGVGKVTRVFRGSTSGAAAPAAKSPKTKSEDCEAKQ